MRTLSFVVDRQIIKRDSKCDFKDLVSGTRGYICFQFSFSKDWEGTKKAISFLNKDGSEIDAGLLDESGSYSISDRIASKTEITFKLYGVKDNFKILTSPCTIYQKEGS